MARELARYNIDIAALAETHLPGEGQLTEVGAGYSFFWSGKPDRERHESGVGFAIKTLICQKLQSLPKAINDRLMTLRLPLSANKNVTIISAYAPTMTNTEETKAKFYDDLDQLLRTVPRKDKLILLGDFNARVGCDSDTWPSIIGRHGVGKMNSNGLFLLTKCSEHALVITNTLFSMQDKFKTSWMHPRSKCWHLIDYVITRQRDIRDVRITRVMRGADCWTDHMMLRSKFNLQFKPQYRPQQRSVKK